MPICAVQVDFCVKEWTGGGAVAEHRTKTKLAFMQDTQL